MCFAFVQIWVQAALLHILFLSRRYLSFSAMAESEWSSSEAIDESSSEAAPDPYMTETVSEMQHRIKIEAYCDYIRVKVVITCMVVKAEDIARAKASGGTEKIAGCGRLRNATFYVSPFDMDFSIRLYAVNGALTPLRNIDFADGQRSLDEAGNTVVEHALTHATFSLWRFKNAEQDLGCENLLRADGMWAFYLRIQREWLGAFWRHENTKYFKKKEAAVSRIEFTRNEPRLGEEWL